MKVKEGDAGRAYSAPCIALTPHATVGFFLYDFSATHKWLQYLGDA